MAARCKKNLVKKLRLINTKLKLYFTKQKVKKGG